MGKDQCNEKVLEEVGYYHVTWQKTFTWRFNKKRAGKHGKSQLNKFHSETEHLAPKQHGSDEQNTELNIHSLIPKSFGNRRKSGSLAFALDNYEFLRLVDG